LCGLTRAPLSQAGGCCHWNVELATRPQKVTLAMIEMLGPGSNETIRDVLDGFDVPYWVDEDDIWIEPDELSLPATTYGLGEEVW